MAENEGMGLAILGDVANNLYRLCVLLAVVFAIWSVVSGFGGWRRGALIASILVGVVSKIVAVTTKKKLYA